MNIDLGIHVTNLKVAVEAMAEGNKEQQKALTDNNFGEKIRKSHTMIDMGLERKNATTKTIGSILKKKKMHIRYI